MNLNDPSDDTNLKAVAFLPQVLNKSKGKFPIIKWKFWEIIFYYRMIEYNSEVQTSNFV